MNDSLPGEESTEISNGAFSWGGKPLEYFSWDHQAALRRLWDTSTEENMLMMVFLCTKTGKQVRRIRGVEATDTFYDELSKWAEDNKITVSERNKGFIKVQAIANAVWADMRKVDFEPELSSGGTAPPNALG